MKTPISVLLLLILGLGGCAYQKPVVAAPRPARASAPNAGTNAVPERSMTPETGWFGKVDRFNDEGRFVVLNFPIGRVPAVGQRLFIYRQNVQVGEVKVSGPQRENLTVADLVAGEAQAGDEVRDK
jgi:hypothetical protein